MRYKIKLKPQDALFFRDGKPFGTVESFAETIFPPNPPSFAGSLRAILINALGGYEEFKRGKNETLKNLIGEIKDENEFLPSDKTKIVSIVLGKDDKLFYPIPSDIGKGKENVLRKFKWEKISALPFYSKFENKYEYIMYNNLYMDLEPLKGYFPYDLMKDYLLDTFDENYMKNSLKGEDYFYIDEEHIKNKLERGKKITPEEGGVYMYKMKRIKEGVYFQIEFEIEADLNIKLKDIIKNSAKFINLGGEGRVAEFNVEKIEDKKETLIPWETFKKKYNKEKDLLKLILITPSIVKNIFPEKLKEYFNVKGISVKSVQKIGGWDTLKKLPKDMFKAYSAGTVFLVEPNEELNESLYYEILNTNFSDDLSDNYLKPYEGFGLILIGIEKNIKGGN